MSEPFDLEIEPDAVDRPAGELALVQSLPAGFNLTALLTFLPDVRLKQRLELTATQALAIDVRAECGLEEADAALAPLRNEIRNIELCFDGTERDPGPTVLSNQLHKRLTGLRADFCAFGRDAVDVVGKRIVAEHRRRQVLADEERRQAQVRADEQARADAKRALESAQADGASKGELKELRREVKTAVAPPVAAVAPPAPQSVAAVAVWRCRVRGTPEDAEPNPDLTELTAPQQEMVLRVLDAIRADPSKLAAIQLNWSYLNKRAAAEKTTFDFPGLEAVDLGGTRAKGRRR